MTTGSFNFTAMLLIVFCTIPAVLRAQEPRELLRLYFDEVQNGKHPVIPKQVSLAENSKSVLEALPIYLKDTAAVVRSRAYTIASTAGSIARVEPLRQQAVSYLVEGANDRDGGNAGLVLEHLTTFRKSDFTNSSKDSIRSLFNRRATHFEEIIRLTGFLELVDLKENIRVFTMTGNPQGTRWSAIVSLARMKDASAIEELMRRVRKLPVNDDVIYKIFPDLVYTRNPEAIAYMVEVLNSDEKNCLTADAEREEPIACGYRVMEQLAPVIDKYPVALDESGDIKTKDYTEALKKVRQWFTKNPDYKILRDNY